MERSTAEHDLNETRQILDRLAKLSAEADNPGVAYRNLEMIHALVASLSLKLDEILFIPNQNLNGNGKDDAH